MDKFTAKVTFTNLADVAVSFSTHGGSRIGLAPGGSFELLIDLLRNPCEKAYLEYFYKAYEDFLDVNLEFPSESEITKASEEHLQGVPEDWAKDETIVARLSPGDDSKALDLLADGTGRLLFRTGADQPPQEVVSKEHLETVLQELPSGGPSGSGANGITPHIGANGNWFIGSQDTGVNASGLNGTTPHIGANGNWFIGEEDTGVNASGVKGNDGVTPHIGVNNNWFIGDQDTGVSAAGIKGKDGITPHIGSNNNWYIGDTDTGISAFGTGDDGITPHIGANGNWFIGEEDTGVKAEGIKGKDGEDGTTPHIGTNGNWYVGEIDTGVKASGAKGKDGNDGLTPYIGLNNNWFIGEEDTGVSAYGSRGNDGTTPHIGENNNWFIGNTDTGVSALGEQGVSGVYVGSGPMPDDCNVQIDPEGLTANIFEPVSFAESKNLCSIGSVTFERTSGYLPIGSVLQPGKTYTLSADVYSSDTDSNECAVYIATSENKMTNTRYRIPRGTRVAVTFIDLPTEISKIVFYAGSTTSNSTGDTATFANIQIEEGSSASNYFPPKDTEVLSSVDYVARKALEEGTNSARPIVERTNWLAIGDSITFGVCSTPTVQSSTVLEETTVTVENNTIQDVACALVAGEHYAVTWNGTVYECLAQSIDGKVTLTEDSIFTLECVSNTCNIQVKDGSTSVTFSITQLTFGSKSEVSSGWARLLAESLGYNVTIMASRGMGYTAAVTGQDPLDNSQPRINLSTLLTRIEALEEDFNLITLAFGINDYATISQATIETIELGLEEALQRLTSRFPLARLVVITPFNSSREGDTSTNYAYGYSYGGRSLKDIADAIKNKCEGFGVECLYASSGFLINNFNINTLLPDATHPSLQAHRLIAKSMARYLLF